MKQNGKIKDFLLWTVLAIVLGLIVSFAFLPLLGVDPVDSLKIMLTETFSDKFTMGNILIKTTPLILTSLAFAFTYKANLYNIGAQGQFYVGCICAVATTLALQTKLPGVVVLLLAFAASILGGGLTGLLIGFLKAKFNANEFLVSMMSTYVVQYVMQLLLCTALQEPKHEYLKTAYIDNSAWLPKIITWNFSFTWDCDRSCSSHFHLVHPVSYISWIQSSCNRTESGCSQDVRYQPEENVYDRISLSVVPLQGLQAFSRDQRNAAYASYRI